MAARIMTEGVKRKEDAKNLRLRVSRRNAYNSAIDLPVYYFLAEPEDYFMEVLFLELESHLDLERPLGEDLKSIIRIQEHRANTIGFFSGNLIYIYQQRSVDDGPDQIFISAARDGRGHCRLNRFLLGTFGDKLLDFISIHFRILMFTLLEGFCLREDKGIKHRVLRQPLAISFSINPIEVHLANIFVRLNIFSKSGECKGDASCPRHLEQVSIVLNHCRH